MEEKDDEDEDSDEEDAEEDWEEEDEEVEEKQETVDSEASSQEVRGNDLRDEAGTKPSTLDPDIDADATDAAAASRRRLEKPPSVLGEKEPLSSDVRTPA